MYQKLKNVVAKTVAFAGLAFALNANAAPIKTDIVFIVDESGSMATVQANLRNNIGLFASILSAGGVDANYALVGYGFGSDRIRTLTDFTDDASFATAANGLVASGALEPAFDAISYALNAFSGEASSFSYRSDAIKNLIILTDEPDNSGTTPFADVDALLGANNALFNAVLRFSDTISSIGPLATNHGGNIFDLGLFGSNDAQVVTDFVTDFANVKLQETLTFCQQNPNDPACTNVQVPVPPMAALFGLAVAGLLMRRKA
jgi:uncharacterized protein (TIGR03382 family)